MNMNMKRCSARGLGISRKQVTQITQKDPVGLSICKTCLSFQGATLVSMLVDVSLLPDTLQLPSWVSDQGKML